MLKPCLEVCVIRINFFRVPSKAAGPGRAQTGKLLLILVSVLTDAPSSGLQISAASGQLEGRTCLSESWKSQAWLVSGRRGAGRGWRECWQSIWPVWFSLRFISRCSKSSQSDLNLSCLLHLWFLRRSHWLTPLVFFGDDIWLWVKMSSDGGRRMKQSSHSNILKSLQCHQWIYNWNVY